ncbi:hypothetical protein BdWA1_000568 [Babesia duncani]|uniref:Uncharacterized protein n=1 Tax=Babesia duncani TaxID=323732 RepID=A0AAD9PME3_9APIC|nr:hypothetical protein BdWA1_000568 [Babesia duncani]
MIISKECNFNIFEKFPNSDTIRLWDMAIHRPVLKQKHKPFKKRAKGKTTVKTKAVVNTTVNTRISRKAKKANVIQKKKSIRASLHVESPRNVFILQFHESANVPSLLHECLRQCSVDVSKVCYAESGWLVAPPILLSSNVVFDGIPRRLLLYSCPRKIPDILTCAATADIVLCLFNGSTPDEPAFDEFG